jgi:hypothetical protein
MAYHTHNVLKFRILGAVGSIEEERNNNPLANKADSVTVYNRLKDEGFVSKDSVRITMEKMAKYGYLKRKKYITNRNGCRYYYVLGDVGKKVFPKLHKKFKNGESLNLRNPNSDNGPYIRTSDNYVEKRIQSLEEKKQEIDKEIEILKQEHETIKQMAQAQ